MRVCVCVLVHEVRAELIMRPGTAQRLFAINQQVPPRPDPECRRRRHRRQLRIIQTYCGLHVRTDDKS